MSNFCVFDIGMLSLNLFPLLKLFGLKVHAQLYPNVELSTLAQSNIRPWFSKLIRYKQNIGINIDKYNNKFTTE